MGLLDGNLDPQTAGALALAGGLLSPGSFGQGLSRGIAGQQAVMTNAQDMDIKKQSLEMQKLQFAVAMRKQQLINDYLSGGGQQTPQAPSQPSIMAGAPGTTPPSAPGSPMNPSMTPSAAPQGGSPFGGLPRDVAAPDLLFNDGKNLADLAMKWQTPASFRPGGYAKAPNGQWMQLPQVPVGSQASVGADGQFHISPVSGGLEAEAAAARAKAAGPAMFKLREFLSPSGEQMSDFSGNTSGFPGAVAGQPAPVAPATAPAASVAPRRGLTPANAASGAATQRYVGSAESDRVQILRDEIAKEKNPADRAALERELASIPASAAAVGSTTALRTDFAPGVKTGADNAQKLMTDSYGHILGENKSAQTVQARLEEIRNFSKSAILGGETQWRDFANNLLNIAGVSEKATDRKTAGDLLEKNASQIALAIGTGTQGTDALRSLAAAANPGRHMTQQAIGTAVDQLQAAAQVQQAKAQLLTPHYNAGNTANYLSTEQQFDKNADYRVFQLNGMTPQQAQAYRGQIGEKAWVELQSKARALQKLGVF